MLLTVIQCDSESFNAALPPKDPTPKFHRSVSLRAQLESPGSSENFMAQSISFFYLFPYETYLFQDISSNIHSVIRNYL